MKHPKKAAGSTELSRALHTRTVSSGRKTPAYFDSSKIQLTSYFTPNSFCARKEPQRLTITSAKTAIFDSKRSGSISTKKNSIELKPDFFSSANFGPKKSAARINRGYFNSTLSNIQVPKETKIENIGLGGVFRKKVNPETACGSGSHSGHARKRSQQNFSLLTDKTKRRIEILESDQNVKGNSSPINIFNIKNYTVLAGSHESKHKKSLSNFEENLILLKNSRPLAKNLKQLLNGSKSMNSQEIARIGSDCDQGVFGHAELFRKGKGGSREHDQNCRAKHESKKSSKDTDGLRQDSKKIASQLGRISDLIQKIEKLVPETKSVSTQKSYSKYYQINFSSTNINSLLKDIAKAKLIKKFSDHSARDNASGSQGSSLQNNLNLKKGLSENPSSMKGQVIREIVSMTQEQLFFEELLQILGEKGVDIENLFAYCYERMKIDIGSHVTAKDTNFRVLSDSYSCLNSEISVLENASSVLKPPEAPSARRKKLRLDMKLVKQEIFSSNDEN